MACCTSCARRCRAAWKSGCDPRGSRGLPPRLSECARRLTAALDTRTLGGDLIHGAAAHARPATLDQAASPPSASCRQQPCPGQHGPPRRHRQAAQSHGALHSASDICETAIRRTLDDLRQRAGNEPILDSLVDVLVSEARTRARRSRTAMTLRSVADELRAAVPGVRCGYRATGHDPGTMRRDDKGGRVLQKPAFP